MIIICKGTATTQDIAAVIAKIESAGLKPHLSRGTERTIIGIIGDERQIRREAFLLMQGVENIIPVLKPYKMASREFHPAQTVVKVGDVEIGGDRLVMIAGPCSVENAAQIET
ncbi:MAG TPA: 3-deoxy-7-phosphoheptulonate synthase, partial [Bacteroidota bacterium]|nr:3-deoxy-7-phosphoheptulonate synthase [Bacteroidota bacterium]